MGRQLLGELGGLIGPRARGRRDPPGGPRGEPATRCAPTSPGRATGRSPSRCPTRGGEDRRVAAYCWKRSGQSGFTRTDVIVGVGGRASTDLAGFVAATWLRGVRGSPSPPPSWPWWTRPSAARQASTPPRARTSSAPSIRRPVSCATWPRWTPFRSTTTSRARRGHQGRLHRRPGDPGPDRVRPPGRAHPARTHTSELIVRSIRVKAEVVSSDLKEAGLREILNLLGHTLGHAIEKNERYKWRHGTAVSVGMHFAAELGRLARPPGRRDRRPSPHHPRSGRPPAALPPRPVAQAGREHEGRQEVRGDLLRFIVLDGLAKPTVLEGPVPGLLLRLRRGGQ